MLQKSFFYISLIGIIVFLSSGFKPIKSENNQGFLFDISENLPHLRTLNYSNDYLKLNVPYTGRYFIGFKEAIAYKESEGKYKRVNSLGYLGKYQFGIETLKSIGIHDRIAFLNSPKMQERAFFLLLSKNKWELRDEIEKYQGVIISGVKITESGILAAAHLGGVGSVKRFLKTNGQKIPKDNNGASVKSYMRDFGGYETSGIIANNAARI